MRRIDCIAVFSMKGSMMGNRSSLRKCGVFSGLSV
jgi:hypothetical protein